MPNISDASTPSDRAIGNRIRERRIALHITQAELAKSIGLTFQQIQKYEKGTNRVAAARLLEISRVLEVDVHFFFLDIDDRLSGQAAAPRHQYLFAQLAAAAAPLNEADLALLADLAGRLAIRQAA